MDRRVRKIVQVLNQSWSAPLRVGDLARRVGLGTSRLEHLFKEQARISIRDFIHERRLSAAATLLLTTEERVSVISFQVGFSHVANFNHAFKRRYGVTPRAFREQQAESEKAETTK